MPLDVGTERPPPIEAELREKIRTGRYGIAHPALLALLFRERWSEADAVASEAFEYDAVHEEKRDDTWQRWRDGLAEDAAGVWRSREAKAPDGMDTSAAAEEPGSANPLSVASWLARDLPPPDFLLGELFSTTSRVELIGPTGLGKTMFALAAAFAIALGRGFLHWRGGKPRRVLYIDGEMPSRLIKARLQDEVRRWGGVVPEPLFVLARDATEQMPPLNTLAGQDFVEQKIKQLGGVDFIVFDNMQSLLAGSMRDEEAWRATQGWVLRLTQRHIGQLWVHHTGHNEDHGYGPKMIEWSLSTTMLMGRVARPEADVAFRLEFPKARERTPDNRADFEPVVVTLAGDTWNAERGAPRRPPGRARAFTLLCDLVESGGLMNKAGKKVTTMDTWQGAWIEAERATNPDAKEESLARTFRRATKDLEGMFEQEGQLVWLIERSPDVLNEAM